MALMRWGRLIRELQEAAAMGAFVELSDEEMTGPTVGYVWTSRATALDDWLTPAEFRLSLTLPTVESDAVEFVKVVLLVRFGQVLTLEV
jgi:hypothetical protein